MGWPLALGIATSALGAPSILDASRRLFEMGGTDITGRLGRQGRMTADQALAEFLGEMDTKGDLWREQSLAAMLGPLQGRPGPAAPSFDRLMDEEGMQNLLMGNQMELGRMAQVMGGPSFEEIALQLGY